MPVRIIDVKANAWQNVIDFYNDVLKQIGAPEWHGKNVNALIDSTIHGGINTIEPPYVIRVHETSALPDHIMQEIIFVQNTIANARLKKRNTTGIDADVALEII